MTNSLTPTDDDLVSQEINLLDREGLGTVGAALTGFPENAQVVQNLLLTAMILGKGLGIPDDDLIRLATQNVDIAVQVLGGNKTDD